MSHKNGLLLLRKKKNIKMLSETKLPVARHKKKRFLFLGSRKVQKKRETFSPPPLRFAFLGARVASVEIPIVRVRASFASYRVFANKRKNNCEILINAGAPPHG